LSLLLGVGEKTSIGP